MKRTIFIVLIMCMFLSCMCFSYAEEKGSANKLEGFDEALKDYNPAYLDLNNQGMIKVWNKEVKLSDDLSIEINGMLADKYETVIFYTIKSTEEKLYESQHLKLNCESLLPFGNSGYSGGRKVYKGKKEIKFINSYNAKLNPVKDNVDFRIDINYGDEKHVTISLPFSKDDFAADYFEKELDINIQKKSVDYKISKIYGSPMQTLLFMESSEVVDDDDEEVVELKKSSLLYDNNELKNFGGSGTRVDKDTFLDHCSFSPVDAKADSLVWKYDGKDFKINLKGSNPSYGGNKDYSKNGEFAVVLSSYKGIKLWTGSGSTTKYDVHKYEDDLSKNDIDKGDIIEYAVENDGTITIKSKVYDARRNKAIGENAKLVKLDAIRSNEVEDENSDNYSNSKDSKYINYSEYKENDNNYNNNLDALKWEDIKKLDIPDSDSPDAITALIVTESKDEIGLLTFIDNYGKTTDSDSSVGYLLSYKTEDDVMTVTVDVFGEGQKEYKVTDDDDQDQIKEHEIEELIVFVLRDGKLKLKDFNYDNHKFYGNADGGKMWFKEKDGNDIIVYVGGKDTTKEYEYSSKVIVYIEDNEKNINSLDEGDALEFIMKDNEILAIKYKEKEKLPEDKQLKEKPSSSESFGVIIKKDKGMDDQLKLWTKTGDTIKYDIDDYENKLNYSDLDEGDIIEYNLQDDGTIDVIAKVYDASSEKAVGEKNVKLIKLSEINKDNIEVEDKYNYFDRSDSLYFDYSEYKENDDNNDDNLNVLKWNNFKDMDIPDPNSNNAVEALLVTDEDEDDEIKLLVFIKNYDEISDKNSYAGYLLEYDTYNDIMTVKVDVFGEGVKEYKVTDYNDQKQIRKHEIEELIVFALRDGELKPKDLYYDGHKLYGDASGGKIWFKEKDGNDIIVYVGNKDTTEEYEYSSKVVIYNDDDEKNINNIDEGDALEFIIKNGEIVAIKYKEKENLPKDKQLNGDSYKNKDFAVIIKTDKGMDDQVKLWTQTDETIKYDIDNYENNLDLDDLNQGDIIEYSLQDDGTIDVIAKIYDASSKKAVDEKNVKLIKLSEINKDNIEDENNDNYYNQSDSLYFDYSEYKENNDNDYDDLDVLKWNDFKDLDIPSPDSSNAIEALLVTDDGEDDEIKLLVFIKNYDEVSDNDSNVGYLLEYDTDDDIMTVKVDVFCEGEKEYKITDDDDQELIKKHGIEELIVFVLRGGELKPKDSNYDDNEFYGDASGGKIWFKEKNGNSIIVYIGDKKTTKKYYYDSKVVIYNDDDEKNINNLDEGDALEFIMRDGEISAIKYQEEENLAKDKQLK